MNSLSLLISNNTHALCVNVTSKPRLRPISPREKHGLAPTRALISRTARSLDPQHPQLKLQAFTPCPLKNQKNLECYFPVYAFSGKHIPWTQPFLFTLQCFIFPTSCNYSHFLITVCGGLVFCEVHTDFKTSNNNQLILLVSPWFRSIDLFCAFLTSSNFITKSET